MTTQRLLDVLTATPPPDLQIVHIAQENLLPDGNIDYQAMNSDPEALTRAAEELESHSTGIRTILRDLTPDLRRRR